MNQPKPIRDHRPGDASSLAAVTSFRGFADPDAGFFAKLARHNERTWFEAHKSEFTEPWSEPMKALVSEVRDALGDAYEAVPLGAPSGTDS